MTATLVTPPLTLSDVDISKANETLVKFLQIGLTDERGEVKKLRDKLAITYWVVIFLSIIMFIMGIVLLSVPIVAAISGEINELQSLIAAGFGITDLAALFLFKPLERINRLMGDMAQITLVLNCYQTQLSLRLLEMDLHSRVTMGKAAEFIIKAGRDSIKIIQNYFEDSDKKL